MQSQKANATRPVKSNSVRTFFKPTPSSRTQRVHTVASEQSKRQIKQIETSYLTVEGLQSENQELKTKINSLKKVLTQQKSR